MEKRTKKKVARKIKRCEHILFKSQNIKTVSAPTRTLFIGNGGFGCGFTREHLLDVFSQFGTVESVVMLPAESYAFVVYSSVVEAITSMHSVNGKKLASGEVLYMAYISDGDVPHIPESKTVLPKGLVLLKNFVSEEEEAELLSALNCKDVQDDKAILKHRKVKHYGYEFLYGSNNVNKNKPLEAKIPEVCLPHLQRLVTLDYLPRLPDQLTVNHYLPGQGIPPHVDTHSAFEDGIISLSLGSQVVMDFYHPDGWRVPVLLPRRSVLVMRGESRYLWKHGITPRMKDIFQDKDDSMTLHHRSTRISLTFRMISKEECHCEYKKLCDSQQKKKRTCTREVDSTFKLH